MRFRHVDVEAVQRAEALLALPTRVLRRLELFVIGRERDARREFWLIGSRSCRLRRSGRGEEQIARWPELGEARLDARVNLRAAVHQTIRVRGAQMEVAID